MILSSSLPYSGTASKLVGFLTSECMWEETSSTCSGGPSLRALACSCTCIHVVFPFLVINFRGYMIAILLHLLLLLPLPQLSLSSSYALLATRCSLRLRGPSLTSPQAPLSRRWWWWSQVRGGRGGGWGKVSWLLSSLSRCGTTVCASAVL